MYRDEPKSRDAYYRDMKACPYRFAPIVYTAPRAARPPMLEYLQNPRGLLALNLARVAYWHARRDGVPHAEALEFCDAELRAVSSDTGDGLAEWCAAGNDLPRDVAAPREPANDDEPRRAVA